MTSPPAAASPVITNISTPAIATTRTVAPPRSLRAAHDASTSATASAETVTPGSEASSPPGPVTRALVVTVTRPSPTSIADPGTVRRDPQRDGLGRGHVVAAGHGAGRLPRGVDDPHLGGADGEHPDQPGRQGDEQRDAERELGGRRARLVRAAAPAISRCRAGP